MSDLWIVASLGHCATTWLATVLDAQPHITAYHELKQKSSGWRWDMALAYEQREGVAAAAYRNYWQTLDEAQTPVVADVNSWTPTMVEAVHKYRPVDRLIYIVRHGVAQLHSLYHHSHVWRDGLLESYTLSDYVAETAGRSVDDLGRWERLCLLWRGAALLPDRLREAGLPVEVVTFEELTQSPAGLQRLLPEMTDDETLAWRRQDVNRKVDGSRRPADLWAQWAPAQRIAFRELCAAGMERYGYEIPEVA